jgi:hypothetical protein
MARNAVTVTGRCSCTHIGLRTVTTAARRAVPTAAIQRLYSTTAKRKNAGVLPFLEGGVPLQEQSN